MLKKHSKLFLFFFIIVSIVVTYFVILNGSNIFDLLQNGAQLRFKIEAMGVYGPVLIIGLMIFAILMSPIPSAPIALAAGAVYGHVEGGLYVLIGSEIGAILAFLTTRLLDFNLPKKLFGNHLAFSVSKSQNTLMAIIFFSRLMPFISFDMISYAAGLTALTFWRFAIATLAGIIPASFLLAHFGSELASSEGDRIAYAILGLGMISLVLLIISKLRSSEKKVDD